jgi:hypothetical protein
MMFASLIAAGLLAASFSLAAPASSDPGALARRDSDLGSLVLIVKAQDDVNDPDDLTVSACLVNTGKNTLKILNDPNGELVPSSETPLDLSPICRSAEYVEDPYF